MAASVQPATTQQNVKTDLVNFARTPPGIFRISEGALALAALISTGVGACYNDVGRYGYTLCVLIVTLVEALFIVAIFVMRYEERIAAKVNVPLSLLINDAVLEINYFIISTLSLLAIGRCGSYLASRIVASLFLVAIFLVFIGILYLDYNKWRDFEPTKQNGNVEHNGTSSGTTLTDSSPTVLS